MIDPTTAGGVGSSLIVTKAAVDAAMAVFNRVILPAATEAGLVLQDKVSHVRAVNRIRLAKDLEEKLKENAVPDGYHAYPQIACTILEKSSWIDDAEVQDWWAGLLSSSCTETGDDDSNLIFVNLLAQMTKLQARVIKFACEKAIKLYPQSGLIGSRELTVPIDELTSIAGEIDIQRLDRELDNLRSLGLIESGFDIHIATHADLQPTPLALHMYVRCTGSRQSPVDYFKALEPPAGEKPV